MIRAGLALAIALSAGGAVAYRAGPPPGHTGAFGEPDCGACHFDAIRDDTTGSLMLRAPDRYEPGQTYPVVVELRHPALQAAGFQLTARFADGEGRDPEHGRHSNREHDGEHDREHNRGHDGRRAGQPAGTLEPVSERTRVDRGENGVAYASHSALGATARSAGSTTWTVRWTAPEDAGVSQAVVFDVAAQVANDDDSEFGERLYRYRHILRPEAAEGRGERHPQDGHEDQ